MNSKLSTVLGIILGCIFGAGGMMLMRQSPPPPEPTPPPAAAVVDAPIKKVVPLVTQKRDETDAQLATMDAPADQPDQPDRMIMVTNMETGAVQQQSERDARRAEWEARRAEWEKMTPEQRAAQFANMWSNRVSTSRSNFVASAKLNEKQTERFDVLTASMNMRLAQKLDPILAQFQNGWHPSSEDRLRITADASAILVGTYDELDKNMPEGWRDSNTNSHFSLTSFVDPKYMPVLHGITGRGGPGGGPGGGRGNWGGGNRGGGTTRSGGAATGG